MTRRRTARDYGLPADLSVDDVKAFFSLPDDDDTMHAQGPAAKCDCDSWTDRFTCRRHAGRPHHGDPQ